MQPHPQGTPSALYEVLAPAHWHMPVVFNSPHSGSHMPQDFLALARLRPDVLRQSEDFLVDELFSGCLDHGAPLLRALASRAWLDLNREPGELDARMFIETLPGHMHNPSPRVLAGFGVIPRLVGEGLEIYSGRIALAEALSRIETYYKPYHRTLSALLAECHSASGFALLVDCHSMPESQSVQLRGQPDIVIGDRFGAACAAEITAAIESFFTSQGFKVARNKPYAGGFITEANGLPRQNRHAIQIEINRSLYMDERRLEPTRHFVSLKHILDRFCASLNNMLQADHLSQGKWAAE